MLLLAITNKMPFFSSVLNYQHPEFTQEWYFWISGIYVQTMILNGLSPAIEAVFDVMERRAK